MIYKTEVWDNVNTWYCGDCRDLTKGSNTWYIPCRILDKTPKEFAEMLVIDFDAKVSTSYHKIYNPETKEITKGELLLFWSFDSEEKAKKYKNYINKMARNIDFTLE